MFAKLIEGLSPTVRAILAALVVLCVFGLTGFSVYRGDVDFKVGIGIALAALVNGSALLGLFTSKKETNVELPKLNAEKALRELVERQ